MVGCSLLRIIFTCCYNQQFVISNLLTGGGSRHIQHLMRNKIEKMSRNTAKQEETILNFQIIKQKIYYTSVKILIQKWKVGPKGVHPEYNLSLFSLDLGLVTFLLKQRGMLPPDQPYFIIALHYLSACCRTWYDTKIFIQFWLHVSAKRWRT